MRKSVLKAGLVLLLSLVLGTGFSAAESKAVETQSRDVFLKDGTVVTEESFKDEYFLIGDHGLLTFDVEEIVVTGETADDAASADGFAGVRIDYKISDGSVVEIDAQTHTYTIVGSGVSEVTLSAVAGDGDSEDEDSPEKEYSAKYCFIVVGDVTDTALSQKKVTTYMVYDSMGSADVPLENCPELKYYTFSYTSSNKSMYVGVNVDVEDRAIHVQSYVAGTAKLTIRLNGKEFSLTFVNKQVTINKDSYFMDIGSSVTLKIKGYSGDIKWKTMKKSVATVTKKGVVKGKKVGTAIIYTSVDGKLIGCAVSVVKKGMSKVVKSAIKTGKTCLYSQPRRMSKGYYDCSSLVWRAYKKIGKYFGQRYYAPVAAAEAKWCADRGKILGKWTYKKVANLTYRPGDVLFRVGANNGRYRGIYHVEMFAGYRVVGFENGKALVSMVWANRPDNNYEPGIDIMGRP